MRLLPSLLAAVMLLSGCGRDSPQAVLASAEAYTAKGDHSAAVVQYKNALQADPDNVAIRFKLGKALLAADNPAAAVIELSKVRDLSHPDAEVLPLLTRALLLLGDYRRLTSVYGKVELSDHAAQGAVKASVATAWAALDDLPRAEAALKAALDAAPQNTVANVLKARLLAGGGELNAALSLAESVVAREPAAYEAWQLLGELRLLMDRDGARAEQAFRKSLEIEPANVQGHTALVSMRLRARDMPGAQAQAEALRKVLPRHPQTAFVDAQLAFYDRKLERARELSQALLKAAPDHVGVLMLAGAVEAELRSIVVAESHYAKALQLNPDLPLARRSLAMIHLRQGRPKRALDVLAPLLGAGSRDVVALALAAEAKLNLGDAAGAEQLFTAAARLDPQNERFQAAVALAQIARGQAESAFVDLERLASQSGTNNFVDLALISARIKRREFDQALQALDALEQRPGTDQAMALSLRGRVHTLRNDLPAARTAFEQALAKAPDDFASIANLAAVDVREGKHDAAIARFDAAIAADARNSLAYIGKAEVMIRRNASFEQVQAVLDAAITAAPSDPEPRLQLIEYALTQRRFKEALALAQSAAAGLPDRPAILDALGRAQAHSGDRLQSLSTFQRAANLDAGSAVPYMRIADLHKADGKLVQAIAALRSALEIDPGLVEARAALVNMLLLNRQSAEASAVARELQRDTSRIDGFMLEAFVYTRSGSPEKAIEVLRAGLRQHPGSSDLAVRLYQLLRSTERTAEAQRFADDWLRLQPQDPNFVFELSTAAINQGDLVRAEALLRQLVQRFPRHPLALNNLAFVLAATGKPGAVEMAERALATRPGNPAIQDTLALALASEGQAAKALQLQKDVVARVPNDDGLRINLARIAIRAGDKALARSELERILAKRPLGQWHGEAERMLKTL